MKLGHTIEESRKKYPELTDEILEELQSWAQEQGLRKIPEEQLALFAHSCYFNKEASVRCMSVYYRMRATVPEFFNNRDPRLDYLQHSLKALEFAALPVPDCHGNRIIFHRLADFRPGQYMFNDGIKLLFMSVDSILYSEGCCPGFIFLFDMRGVKLGHLTRLSIGSIRRFFEYIQEGLPVRLKGIYVLNAVWFMDKILSLIKPFIKRELFNMLHLYTGDVSDVYEHLPPECLPEDFGGKLDSAETLHESHCRRLDQLRDYFLEEESLYRSFSGSEKTCTDGCNVQSSGDDQQEFYEAKEIGDVNET